MAYIKDIIDGSDGALEYTVTLIGDGRALCEGFKDVLSFGETEIKLRKKKVVISVVGESLELEKLYDGYIAIRGKISGVYKEGV